MQCRKFWQAGRLILNFLGATGAQKFHWGRGSPAPLEPLLDVRTILPVIFEECDSLPLTGVCYYHGRRHGFESGGDNFASGASKIFFGTPHFLANGGGDKILLR